jgi:hypothetical protein
MTVGLTCAHVAITVRFAVLEPWNVPFAALVPTGYVPGAVLADTVSVKVAETVWPGLAVIEVAENVPCQPLGWVEPRLKEPAEHPDESLLVTDTM